MAARRALERIKTSKARLVFRYEISDLFMIIIILLTKINMLTTSPEDGSYESVDCFTGLEYRMEYWNSLNYNKMLSRK